MLFSQKEAELVSLLPIKPFTAKTASRNWKMDLASTQKVLDELASRAILVDIDLKRKSLYVLPPPMAGFFEFSLMINSISAKMALPSPGSPPAPSG